MFTNGAVNAAQLVIAEATPLIKQDFPHDSQEEFERDVKRAFKSIKSSPHAILNAEAVRQAYRAFRT